MKVNVLFFAAARESTGMSSTILEVRFGAQLWDVINGEIMIQFPSLQVARNRYSVALNKRYVGHDETLILHEYDEIAILPPISGG